MASLSNINGLFDVHSTGAILFSTSHGTSGQILKSNGNAAPTWVAASTVIGGPYLPLTGGTLTGPLSGTSATFAGNVTLGANTVQNGANPGLKVTSTNTSQTVLSVNNTTTRNYELAVGGSASGIGAGSFYIYDGGANAARMIIDSNGALLVGGTASPSTSWKYPAVFGQQGTSKVIIGYLTGFSENIVGGHNSNLTAWDSLTVAGADLKFRTGAGAADTSMTIDISGNVGIGTALPSTPLTVNRALNSALPTLYLDTNGGGGGSVGLGQNTAIGPYLVGNTLPNGDVRGAYSASRMLFNGGGFSFQTSTETSGARTFDDKMKILINGNVGIGTTSPTNAKLVISDTGSNKISIDGGTSQNGMRWEAVGGANGFYLFNGTFGTAGFGLYNINTAQAPLWIQNGGNVGIGTTSPSDKLSVYNGSYAVNIGGYSASWVGNSVYPTIYGSSSDRWIMITSPHIPYLENGVDGYTGSTAGSRIRFASDSGSGIVAWDAGVPHYGAVDTFTIGRNSVPFVTVKNNGRVGIGTTTPRAKLEVAGDITIQNGVYTYKTNGYTSGASAINVDITVGNEGGAGNVFKIEAGFAHYYGMAYNSIGEWWCTSRGATVINTYILNAGTSLAGTWSSSKPNTTTLRVTKSAGTYGGGGKWWVKVTYVPF